MTDTITQTTTHPRVIRIPAPAAPASAPRVQRNVIASIARQLRNRQPGRFAIFLAVLILLVVSAGEIWRQTGYTFRQFDMRPRLLRMTDAERMQRANAGLAGAAAAYQAAYAADPREIAFGFSQAEMSYYSRAPFISYFDDAAVPFLKIKEPEDLWKALRARNVGYVLQPAYPLAELNNSAFDAMLSDPHLTEVIYEKAGTRLIRLLPSQVDVKATVLFAEGIADRPLRVQDWSVASPKPPYNTGPAKLTQSPDGITMTPPRALLGDRQRWDFVDRGLPVNSKPGAFNAPLGRLRLSMEVTGRGRFDFTAVHLSSSRATVYESIVWSGVLTGQRRIISGQILTPVDAAFDAEGRRPMGIILRGYRSGGITIHNWKVESIPSEAEQTPAVPAEAFAPTPATPPLPPLAEVSYVLRQPPEVNGQAIEALVAAGRIEAMITVAEPGPAPTGVVYCADGRPRKIALVEQPDGALAAALPCWPRAAALVWAGTPRSAPRIAVKVDGAERIVNFVPLADLLPPAPPKAAP